MTNRSRFTAAQLRERGITLPFRPISGSAPLRFEPPKPPAVPRTRSARPAEPFPGERIDANGNAIRPRGWYVARLAAPRGPIVEVLRDQHGRERARRDAGDIC